MRISRNIILVLMLVAVLKNNSFSQCTTTYSTTSVTVCAGLLPYFWNGIPCNAAGSYTKNLTNYSGCDSIASLTLSVSEASSSQSQVTLCMQELPYVWNGKTYTSPGIYKTVFSNNKGCDSIVTLVLKATNTWEGTASNNWEDPANWSCHAVPNPSTDVTIHSGTVVVSSSFTVRSLTVAPGATVTVAPGFNISINPTLPGAPVYLARVEDFSSDTSTGLYGIRIYHYDDADRLQSVVTYSQGIGDPGGFEVGTTPDSFIYYYHTADTLPFQALHYNGGTFNYGEYFTYDAQARVTQRLLAYNTGGSATVYYAYLPNEITSHISTMGTTLCTMQYNGSNITSRIMDAGAGAGNPVPDTVSTTFSILQNPFNLVSIYRHTPDLPVYSDMKELGFNRNTPVKVMYRGGNTEDYQYLNIVNGLPAKAIILYNSLYPNYQYYYYRQ